MGTPVAGVEDVDEEGKGCVCGGRRAREREKAGEGKMVRALARMLVVVSGWRRWGLNWYLSTIIVGGQSICFLIW